MTIKTVAHLNFRGNARDALTFYHSVFDGEIVLVTYADAHAVKDPAEQDQIIWGQVASHDGFHIMAYDVPQDMEWNAARGAFYVSVRGDDDRALERYWEKLCEGGQIVQPIGPSGFSPLYGMVKDQFGITWVLDLQTPSAEG